VAPGLDAKTGDSDSSAQMQNQDPIHSWLVNIFPKIWALVTFQIRLR